MTQGYKIFGLILIAAAATTFLLHASSASAATNISSSASAHWAWNDLAGWIDFYSTGNVNVTSTNLSGYASSSFGDFSLDATSTQNGNWTATSSYRVYNDGIGDLTGWAWNDVLGWISFCGGQNTANCPGTASSYQVTVDPTSGIFRGWAWSEVGGWVSFNCSDPNICATSNYDVVTSWQGSALLSTLDSTTFDTGVSGGAQINSILWYGANATTTQVKFQFATSNASSGPWTTWNGVGGASTYYTPVGPGTELPVDFVLHNNQRYFRYRVSLYSDVGHLYTPRVDDILINWSP
jgi:hypothetical protein